MAIDTPADAVPPAALWLGGLGALPFVALAAGHILTSGEAASLTGFALAAYGAVILSFLGGIRWGLAVAPRGVGGSLTMPLTLSVVPSLIGWGALLAPAPASLLILASTFLAVLLWDRRAAQTGAAPFWYPRLRVPLTTVVVTTLLAGAFL